MRSDSVKHIVVLILVVVEDSLGGEHVGYWSFDSKVS